MNTDTCILNGCYNYLYDMCLKNPNDTHNWVFCVRNEICRIGLNNLWHLIITRCSLHQDCCACHKLFKPIRHISLRTQNTQLCVSFGFFKHISAFYFTLSYVY
jgi:hypothetical protein